MNAIHYAESTSQFSTTSASVYVQRSGENVSLVVRDKDGNAFPVLLKETAVLSDLFARISELEDSETMPQQIGTMIGYPEDEGYLVFIESFSHKGLVRDESSPSPRAVKANPLYTTRLRIAVVMNKGGHHFAALFSRQIAREIASELRGE